MLLRATDAIRLCREGGYEPLPSSRAVAWLDRLDRQKDALRNFVARARLAGFPAGDMSDASLRAWLRSLVRSGQLAVIRKGEGGAGDGSLDDSQRKQKRLVREIEAKSRGRLSHEGRQYKLVADFQLGQLSNRDSYEVVSQRDAAMVLQTLAHECRPRGPDLAKLLGEAILLLTRDWRPPLNPNGLILLRRLIVQEAYRPDPGPALTPSQLRQLGKSDWIEVELVDQDGEPYSTHYRLELADKSIREGMLDQDGFAGVYQIESGSCQLVIGEVKLAEAAADDPAAATPEAPVEDEPEQPSGEADADTALLDEALSLAEEESYPITLRFKLLDLAGEPIPGLAVSIAGTKVTSNAQGMVEAEVSSDASRVPMGLAAGERTLHVGALDYATGDEAWKSRLFNLGFLWDTSVDWNDDEAILALEDFQAQYHLALTGKLDEATKAKLAEVYGC